MQECVRETDSGKKDFLLSVSEHIMAQGFVIVIFENPGSIQIAPIHIVGGGGVGGEGSEGASSQSWGPRLTCF